MEDKLLFKDSHIWTLSDFIERRKDWDQRDEVRLREYLQQLSNKITQGAKNTLNELNDLVASVDDTVVQIANINNEFQLLADKQFIENKVQEEDETVQKEVEKPVTRNINDANTLVNNVKEALKNSFKAIDNHFEKITVVISDSDDDDDDELKHEETVLRPRPFYKKLNLPSLSGNSQSEITANIVMSSDSDCDVEQPIDTFKDEQLLFSNDALEEDVHSNTESKSIQEHDPQLVDTFSNTFEPEKLKPKNIFTYTDNTEDDLFSPPPLLNDDEDDLDNDYNIFGHSSDNMYGESNLWDNNDDDDNNFSNDPPLPIYSEEPPQQVIKSHIQEKIEAPNIQQSLNNELRKRFQKDNISSSSNNVNVESLKVKLPKGAFNILGGSDIKPYIASSTQNTKQTTISEISKSINERTQDDNVNKDLNVSNKLFIKDNQNPVISTHKDLKKETKPIKTQSLFKQDSDEEDLFVDKTPKVNPTLKPEITKEKENLIKNIKLSRPIFSESDSDEEIMNSKSTTTKKSVSNSSIDKTKLLDSSSDDDDLFNINNNKSIPKLKSTIFSSEVHEVNESNKIKNEIKQKLITPIKKDNVNEILNKKIVNESKMDLEESCINAHDKVIDNEISNNCTLHSNVIDTLSMDNATIPSNQTFPNSQYTKKYNNLFSSDEEEFNDSTFFNVNESNKNSTKIDQTITNPTKLVKNRNHDNMYASKVKMFDSSSSSSDDDMFNTDRSNISFASIKNNKQSDEIISIEPQLNDNLAVINKVQKTEHIDEINAAGKVTNDKNNTNIFSLLSDEDEDDNYLAFKNDISDSPINLFNSQDINKTVKAMSSSSEEFLSPQIDLKDNDIFCNSSHGSLFDTKDRESFNEKKPLDISKNETLPISTKTTIQNIESSIFSNSDDEQHLSFNSKILNESHKYKISQASYSNASKESLKDYVDGSSFSLPNSESEKSKKLPGKLNKNVGAFINVASLLPNSKSPLKKSDIHRSASLDENNDESLPSSGTKLFSAEKDRAKIQVKRRPQSRKARHAAARISFIDIGQESNFNESSRLFGSSSDLVDYQSSPILNDDFINSSNEVQNKNQELLNNKLPLYNNDKIETNNEVKKIVLDLFDDSLDPIKFNQEEINKNNNKEEKLDEKQVCKLVYNDEQLPKIETVQESLLEIEPTNETNLEIKPVSEEHTRIKPISDEEVKGINVIEVEENKLKSITQNSTLFKKSKSLFDDDDDDLFSPKCEKVKKSSFNNIFESDDEFEFNQKFTKKNSVKTNSIFGDDSDDDLFNTSSKCSASNLSSQKPNDKMSRQQNRSCADGYIKLAAESVAINPLESKKN